MTVSEEEIMAYADGELDEASRARIAQAALSDLDLAERIAAQRALRDRLQAHFAPVAQEPLPAAWAESIRQHTPSAQVIDLATVRAERAARADKPASRRRAWVGGAVAACLAVALFATTQPWRRPSAPETPHAAALPIVAEDGVLVASGELGVVLDRQLASAQEGAPIRILGSFHRAGGGLCRAFAGPQASGVACHEAGQWQLQHVLPGSRAATTAYRQVSSQDGALMAIAQSMAQGAPLDAAQEQAAQKQGWR